MEGCEFRDRKDIYGDKQVKIFGVSFDSVEDNRAFAEKFDFNFPLLCDTDRVLGMAFGACSGPDESCARRVTVVIDANGVVEQVVDTVDAKTHPASLLEHL
ncbi:MAG TPA: redoxin domain-containing protein [Myxococcales bacterium]|nr:redoxin domain-containing protein [Myxococcales bacterium]